MAISFYFNFISSGAGIKEIDEPFGFDTVPFGIKQDEGRKGRDVLYAGGGDAKFSIGTEVNRYGHQFDRFKADWERYRFEVEIEFMIDFGNGIEVVGNVYDISMNQVSEIEFVVRQKNIEAKYKRNFDIATNPLSNKDIEGNSITPVQPKRMLLKAKPIIQRSEWRWPEGTTLEKTFLGYGQDFAFVMPYPQVVSDDIQNTYAQYQTYEVSSTTPSESELQGIRDRATVVRTTTTAKDITVLINGINLLISNTGFSVKTIISLSYGTTYQTGEYTTINLYESTSSNINLVNQQYSVVIPAVTNTTKIWITVSVGQPFSTPGGTPVSNTFIQFSAGRMTMELKSIALNTVIQSLRYIDVIKYATKSASGLETYAPRFEYGGEFYDQYLTTTALMRGLLDKPFNISCKDIVEEHIQAEINGDYEVDSQSRVFYGLYRDFFRDYECAYFDEQALDGFSVLDGDKFMVNKFSFKYKNFASQKENDQENTYDIVHGETEWKSPNKQTEGERTADVGFVRDAFMLALAQRKSYDTTDTTATQDDDKKYIIDVVELPANTSFTETFELQHNFDDDTNILTLRNTGIFTFTQLGIVPLTVFQILNGDNAGSYTVAQVSEREVKLFAGDAENISTLNTTFKYFIDPTVTLTNRTNEGFEQILNIADGDNYANLRFTAKRNILNYFNEELATYIIARQNESYRNTIYKNNPDAITKITGEPSVKEGDTFNPTGAILDGKEYKLTIIMTLQQFWDMVTLIRSQRGFIRTIDADGLPIKLYIANGEWVASSYDERTDPDEMEGKFECTAYGKYEPYIMQIFIIDGILSINNQTIPSGFSYQIDEFGKVSLFDSTGKLLYTPIVYDRIKINNAIPQSVGEIEAILSQYDRY